VKRSPAETIAVASAARRPARNNAMQTLHHILTMAGLSDRRPQFFCLLFAFIEIWPQRLGRVRHGALFLRRKSRVRGANSQNGGYCKSYDAHLRLLNCCSMWSGCRTISSISTTYRPQPAAPSESTLAEHIASVTAL
jgi:hypothetical protein